jgi:hypothetical protein
MEALHSILFNMIILYSFFLGVYGAVLASRNEGVSGNFWGSMLVFAGLSAITTIIGIIIIINGGVVESGGRNTIYILYMAFITVIMPGLFSLLRGRDDRNAAIAFSILALFNASVAFSMFQRGLVTWVLPS